MNNSIKLLILSLSLTLVFCRCTPNHTGPIKPTNEFSLSKNGFFIVNEGTYNTGTGSLDFYSFDSNKVYNSIFHTVSGSRLGDVAQSMTIFDTIAMVVVNNSAKIEFISTNSAKSLGKIDKLTSPREIALVDKNKAYLSDLYSSIITIINPSMRAVIGTIPIGRASEALVITENKLFAANWSRMKFPNIINNKIMVIDINSDKMTDSISVGIEPESMVLDANGHLWVLCSGGYTNEELPTLFMIDCKNNKPIQTFTFPDIISSPQNLCIDEEGQNLYFINNGIYRMNIHDDALPKNPIIVQNSSQIFYGLGVIDDKIIVSDAIDYNQKGIVFIYTLHGDKITSFKSGICPKRFYTNRSSTKWFALQ